MEILSRKKNLILSHSPGHSKDGISVLVEEDRVLFAGDAFLPLPYIVDGDMDESNVTIKRFGKMGLENIVQGHGDLILRGEIDEMISSHLVYLDRVQKEALNAVRWNWTEADLRQIPIEKCGKSRILLNGLAPDLHYQNLVSLFHRFSKVEPAVKTRKAKGAPGGK